MKHNPRKSEGIALTEVIISIAIISLIVTFGARSMMTNSMENSKAGEVKQQAAMYGQQIFEDFRTLDLTKVSDKFNLVKGPADDYGFIKEYNTPSEAIDLGNRYKGSITVNANTSEIGTALNKEIDIAKSYKYSVNITEIPSTLIIYVKKTDTEKEITIKDENDKILLDETFTFDDAKKMPIKLSMNFNRNETLAIEKNVEIKVCNQAEEYINIVCEDKPKNLFLSLAQYGEGEFTFYDKSINKDLYDITVNITRDGKTVFNGSASLNMKVIK